MSHKKRLVPFVLAAIVAGASLASLVHGQNVPSVKPYVTEKLTELKPLKNVTADVKNTADLKAIEERVEVITRNALPAIVNIQITMVMPDGTLAGEQGSGVIVSKDGYVLTAGHVSGEPGKDCVLVLSNGTRVLGKTMGANSLYDSGMIKIESRPNEEFPFMPMGSISNGRMKPGDWVIAMGHPGGLQRGRAPVVRLGKVLQIIDRRSQARNGEWFFQTDCPLIMGDSGGPVFDMDGKVVGINSKIGLQTTSNIHVPIDTFEDTWDRLAKGDKWGPSNNVFASRPLSPAPDAAPPRATLNASVDEDPKGIVVKSVREDKAADKAHITAGDIITKVDGTLVKTYDDLKKLLSAHKPGDKVTLDLLGSTSTSNAKTRQVQVILDAADR